MRKTLLLAALAAVVCTVPGSAKDLDVESLFSLKIGEALADMRAQTPIQDPMKVQRINAVSRALLAMNDGPEIGGQVVAAVRDKGTLIDFRKQSQSSVMDCPAGAVDPHEGCARVLYISDTVSLYPRVLAPLIAREMAKLMVGDMMDCAERRYMERSIEVRSWLELGGDRTRLPVIEPLDGYADAALAKEFKVWLDNKSEMALYRIAQETKTSELPDLMAETDAQLAKLQANDPAREMLLSIRKDEDIANKRFVAFLLAENDWRQANP
ncbi:MAG: hypothetical protein NTY77_03670 [Elusimicrobia bacterium]|nr:hypothetical protein [Elusimicrobiota bacterium]